MSDKKPVLLLVCGRSCGSIDWVLPALHAVEQEGNFDVIVFFKCETRHQRLQKSFRDLASILDSGNAGVLTKSKLLERLSIAQKWRVLLRSTLRQVHHRQPLKASKQLIHLAMQLALLPFTRSAYRANRLEDGIAAEVLASRLRHREVAYLFFDHPVDVPNYSPAFGDAEIVYYQHGTLSFDRLEDNWQHIEYMKRLEPLDAIPQRATWLIGSPREEQYYRRVGVPCRIFASGHPKFDPRWVHVLRQHAAPLRAPIGLPSNAGPRKRSVLFLSIPGWKFSNAAHRKRLLTQLFRVARKHHWDLHVKLHPDERKKHFQAIAQSAGCDNIQWCENSVSGAATHADFVVCFPTSAAMDAVAAGAPVIEFFDFTAQMHSSFVEANGGKTSIYRTEGLAEPANNEEDLGRIAERAAGDDGYLDRLRTAQHSKLAGLFAGHDRGTDRVLDLLGQLRNKDQSSRAA
jgi:hypothetical protein